MVKNRERIVVSGTGCALCDFIYNNISFNSPEFIRYAFLKAGNAGLSPGRLVFAEDLEAAIGEPYKQILQRITGNRQPDSFNAGGPSLVSLIHAAQLGWVMGFNVNFYGIMGEDDTALKLDRIIRKTPLNIDNFRVSKEDASPFTLVLSDPDYNNGTGERTFINHIGVAGTFTARNLQESFYDADITCFGGTALVPGIHDDLTSLLQTAKNHQCITVVNTVYDFMSEKSNPGQPWPLVSSPDKYPLIDVLIMDLEEALRISGKNDISQASGFFASSGVGSFFITNGARDMHVYSRGSLFRELNVTSVPVSKKLILNNAGKSIQAGDTTGCGDNFAGGIIASLAWQAGRKERGRLDILPALAWGAASGGWALKTLGGVYLERCPGEKFELVSRFRNDYYPEISGL